MKAVNATIAIIGLVVLILVGLNAWHTLQDRKARINQPAE
jgi:sensor domain CHASE-containing protein